MSNQKIEIEVNAWDFFDSGQRSDHYRNILATAAKRHFKCHKACAIRYQLDIWLTPDSGKVSYRYEIIGREDKGWPYGVPGKGIGHSPYTLVLFELPPEAAPDPNTPTKEWFEEFRLKPLDEPYGPTRK